MRLATYNVLATPYIRTEYYPLTPAEVLDPAWRVPAVAERLLTLGADIYCLQELDDELLEAATLALQEGGYAVRYLRKGAGKPDGCATFVRKLDVVQWHELRYADGVGRRDSGHVALLLEAYFGGKRVAIANTHLKWDPSDRALGERWGYRQVLELMETLCELDCDEWIVCGDLNVVPRDELVRALRSSGLEEAFDDVAPQHTFVAKGKPRKIDYVFHSAGLEPRAQPLVPLTGESVLPCWEEPSDHLPLVVDFYLR